MKGLFSRSPHWFVGRAVSSEDRTGDGRRRSLYRSSRTMPSIDTGDRVPPLTDPGAVAYRRHRQDPRLARPSFPRKNKSNLLLPGSKSNGLWGGLREVLGGFRSLKRQGDCRNTYSEAKCSADKQALLPAPVR